MNTHIILYRTLTGLMLVCLAASVFLGGCSGSQSAIAPQPAPQMITSIGAPTAPTANDLNIAAAKPAAGQEVATFPQMTISMQNGQLFIPAGLSPSFQIDLGNDGTVDGTAPLLISANLQSFTTAQPVVLPAGDSQFSLSQNTSLAIIGMQGSESANFWTKVPVLAVPFTVMANGSSPTWTLPTTFDLKLNAVNNESLISGSHLILHWDPSSGSVPPHGVKGQLCMSLQVSFYNNNTLVATASKIVPIVNNVATFDGNSALAFNSMNITLDLREAK